MHAPFPVATLLGIFLFATTAGANGPALPDSPEALEEGAAIFERRCSQCHGLDGVNYKGPWLNGILDRPSASVPDWAYSDALRAWGGVWSVESLQAWLARPQDLVPENAMNFGGFRNRIEDRDKVIAWLISRPSSP
jgi:cytochrome c